MLTELAQEEITAALDTVVGDVLCDADVRRPPVDAFRVARQLGITVAADDRQQGRARYVRLRGRRAVHPRATILLRGEPRSERQHWAVAHEIGEHMAHRVFALLGADPCEALPNAREAVAVQLANRLLLPSEWFAADAARDEWDLFRLKARYTTASHELIARRMFDFRPPVIISIFDHARLTFRRSNVSGRVPAFSPAEVQCWRAVHDSGRSHQAAEGLRTIHGWPVHEAGWKREILRTELEEGEVDM